MHRISRRLEHGREQLDCQTVDACSIVRTCAEFFRKQAAEAGLELRVVCPDHETPLHTDPGKLRQILTNLLANAFRFTTTGHVGITLIARPDTVIFAASDTGVGISAEAQERVFDLFWQGEPKAPGSSNVGLGLTIARQLTHLLGGRITLESEQGRGTTFYVHFPSPPATSP